MTESANPLLSFSMLSLATAQSGLSLAEGKPQTAPAQGFSALYARFAENIDAGGVLLEPLKVPLPNEVYAAANHWQAGNGLQSEGSLLPLVSASMVQTVEDMNSVANAEEGSPSAAEQSWAVPAVMQLPATATVQTLTAEQGMATSRQPLPVTGGQLPPMPVLDEDLATMVGVDAKILAHPRDTNIDAQGLVAPREQAKTQALGASSSIAGMPTALASDSPDAPSTTAVMTTNSSAFTGQELGSTATLVGQQTVARLAGMKLAAADVASSTTTPVDMPVNTASLSAEVGRAQASAAYTATAAQPATQGSLNMLQPSWGEAVVQRVMWLSAQGLKSAEIALDPPELGALQVRISTQNDQATVSFTSPHAQVRESLDQNMPRLREMLDQQGLSLSDASVADQGRSQHAQEQERGSDDPGVASDDAEELLVGSNEQAETVSALTLGTGIIDHYA